MIEARSQASAGAVRVELPRWRGALAQPQALEGSFTWSLNTASPCSVLLPSIPFPVMTSSVPPALQVRGGLPALLLACCFWCKLATLSCCLTQ